MKGRQGKRRPEDGGKNKDKGKGMWKGEGKR